MGDQRYEGICDKDGCDFNSYRMGDQTFYGPGKEYTVDTTQPFTIVTQFITDDGTDTGTLVDIVRFYVQHGKVIENSKASILGPKGGNSITDEWCSAQKRRFGNPDDFTKKGGLKTMGEALGRGMVLVLSLWDDSDVSMLCSTLNFLWTSLLTRLVWHAGPAPGVSRANPHMYGRSTRTQTWSSTRSGLAPSVQPSAAAVGWIPISSEATAPTTCINSCLRFGWPEPEPDSSSMQAGWCRLELNSHVGSLLAAATHSFEASRLLRQAPSGGRHAD